MKTSLSVCFKTFFRRFANGREVSDEALIRSVDECRNISALQNLHSEISLRRHLAYDPSIAVKLMRAYAACGEPSHARRVFDESPERNVIFFNVMIRSYVAHGLHRDALLIFSDMARLHGVKPDNYTFPCALKACTCSKNLSGGVQIHGAVSKLGLDSNVFVGNALITVYASCGSCDDAHQVFERMPHRDVVSWNAVISGYAQRGLNEQALEVCREMMQLRRLRPDAGTIASISLAMSNSKPVPRPLQPQPFSSPFPPQPNVRSFRFSHLSQNVLITEKLKEEERRRISNRIDLGVS